MRIKPKFDKQKCLKCKFHCKFSAGYHVVDGKGEGHNIACNYASITNSTCLKRVARDELKDLRGEDYNNCRLFVEGAAILGSGKGVII